DRHQPEWFVPLDGEQQRASIPQQLVLALQIGFAHVLHQLAIQMRLELGLEIIAVERLHFPSDLQRHSSGSRDLDGEMRSFHWRDASQEGHKILLLLAQPIRVRIYAVVDGAYLRQLFAMPLKVADGDV